MYRLAQRLVMSLFVRCGGCNVYSMCDERVRSRRQLATELLALRSVAALSLHSPTLHIKLRIRGEPRTPSDIDTVTPTLGKPLHESPAAAVLCNSLNFRSMHA